jgi:hypothetical protein
LHPALVLRPFVLHLFASVPIYTTALFLLSHFRFNALWLDYCLFFLTHYFWWKYNFLFALLDLCPLFREGKWCVQQQLGVLKRNTNMYQQSNSCYCCDFLPTHNWHDTDLTEITNKMRPCSRIYYSSVS